MPVSNPTDTIVDLSGNTIVVADGATAPASGLVVMGSDGTNAQTALTDTTGRFVFVGAGTAGVAAGGVLSIQGIATGTPISVSGTVTAANASVSITGSAPPASATYIGGNDGTNLVGFKMKPASTAAIATDPSLVVALSPNSPIIGAGVAGTPAGGVVSIQGVAGGTALPVTLSGGGDTTATGSLGALNVAVSISLQGTNGVSMQLVAGTLIGTIVAELSFDGGSTWVGSFFDDPTTGNKVASIVYGSSNTAAARVISNADGASNARVRVSLYTSGTTTVNLRASSQIQPVFLTTGAAGGTLPPTITQVGGTDGSNLRTILTDTGGRQIVSLSDGVTTAGVFPAGFLRTSDEPRQLFYDPFDSSLDVTNRWSFSGNNTGGGLLPSVALGVLTLGTGTVFGGFSVLTSKPVFTPTVPAWMGTSAVLQFENPIAANGLRFFGQGTSPAIPTTASPVTEGYGFEVDTAGKLWAVTYAAGARTQVQDLSASGNNKQPLDALSHRYIIFYRTDKIYWYIDNLGTPVATSNFQGPNVQTLPVNFTAVAGVSLGSSDNITCSGVAVWDTGKNSSGISDAIYPWRKARVTAGVVLAEATSTAALVVQDVGAGVDESGNLQRPTLRLMNGKWTYHVVDEVNREMHERNTLALEQLVFLAGGGVKPGQQPMAMSTPVTMAVDQPSIGVQQTEVIGAAVLMNKLNALAFIYAPGCASVAVTITLGTLSATLTPEVSFTGVDWIAGQLQDPLTGAIVATLAATAAQMNQIIVSVPGASYYRVRISAFTSGRAVAQLHANEVLPVNPSSKVQGTTANSGTSVGLNPILVGGNFTGGNTVQSLQVDSNGVVAVHQTGAFIGVQSASVVTSSGSQLSVGAQANGDWFFVVNVGTVTGTLPTLTFRIDEIMADNSTITGRFVQGAALTTTGQTQVLRFPELRTGTWKVTWTIGGTGTPTFNGVSSDMYAPSPGAICIPPGAASPPTFLATSQEVASGTTAATLTSLMEIWHAATVTGKVEIHCISVSMGGGAGGAVSIRLVRISAVGTGGVAVTPTKPDQGDAAAATTVTAARTVAPTKDTFNSACKTVAGSHSGDIVLYDSTLYGKPLTMRNATAEGWEVDVTTVTTLTTAAQLSVNVWFTELP